MTEKLIVDTDDLSSEQLEALEKLAGVELDEETFESIDAIAERESYETGGAWFAWPKVPGARVLIAHISAAALKMAKLERAYRAKLKRRLNDSLPADVQFVLYRDAVFGTVVKGWSGIKRADGAELPFSEENFRDIWKLRRFRDFVAEKAGNQEGFERAFRADAGEA